MTDFISFVIAVCILALAFGSSAVVGHKLYYSGHSNALTLSAMLATFLVVAMVLIVIAK
jgi:hypothetical protein